MIDDKNRNNFIYKCSGFTTPDNMRWVSSKFVADELRLFSETRFDKYAGHIGEELCDRHPDCGLAVFRSEDKRAGREL